MSSIYVLIDCTLTDWGSACGAIRCCANGLGRIKGIPGKFVVKAVVGSFVVIKVVIEPLVLNKGGVEFFVLFKDEIGPVVTTKVSVTSEPRQDLLDSLMIVIKD